jgi:tetratricopeptide (TPR) repeat protein
VSDEPATFLASGQAHEGRGEYAAALACYDEAIAGIRAQPSGPVETRRQLGVAWMNRGNALQKLADAASLAAAVRAYDEAIAVLRTLPIETTPAYRNHLGAAWVNRGHTQLATGDFSGAIASFEQAIAILSTLPLAESPYYLLNLTGAWTNLSHALLTAPPGVMRSDPLERACVAARNALHFVRETEQAHAAFAEMSLRARRALVTALGERLVAAGTDGRSIESLASEASDAIDDGLALAREWESRGVGQFRPLALRLFRMGAQLYQLHQPHFLGEFVLENLACPAFAGDAEFRAAADAAIEQALFAVNRPQLLVAGTPDAEKLLATAQSLRAARDHLISSSA